MALTHIAQTFSADPFLRVTQYDPDLGTATVMDLDPLVVSRPSVVKFTKDQNSLLITTDRIPAGVSIIDDTPSTTNLVMSKNGRTLVEETAAGANFFRMVGGKFKLLNALVSPGYELVGIGSLGDYIVLQKGGVDGSYLIYKFFGSTFILDHEFGEGVVGGAVLAKDIIIYRTTASANLRQLAVYGYADAAMLAAVNATVSVTQANFSMSKSGNFVFLKGVSNVGSYPTVISFALIGGVYTLGSTVTMADYESVGSVVANDTENRVVALVHATGAALRLQQWLLASNGALTNQTVTTLSSNTWASVARGMLLVPPTNTDNKIYFMAPSGNGMSLVWNGSQYNSGTINVGTGFPFSFLGWVEFSGTVSNFAMNLSGNVRSVLGGNASIGTPYDDFPEYDPDFPVAGGAGITRFVSSDDGLVVAYIHNGSGTAQLYAGTRDNISALGTYVSYYERSGTDWERVGVAEHPEGYKVKNVAFRGEDGNAVSYFLTDGPDNAIEGRYVYDGNTGSARTFELKGEILDAALTNTFLEYGWDDYFVASYDYSDARPSALKLYQFGSLAMDFTEKDSIEIVFGPLTLTNCWDIIVANGPLNNPFTLYKRDGDEIIEQAPLGIEWFEEYGTITDMVALEDCSGFIVVTDENKVIVIDVPPVDPENPEERPDSEIKDILELFPEPDPELVDPDEPIPEQEKPDEPPEEITLDETGKIVITYPPNPSQPAPGQEGQPNQPSAPVYPPGAPVVYPPVYPPGSVPLPPPGIPQPPQLIGKPIEGGGGLESILRTARVSVNFTFER